MSNPPLEDARIVPKGISVVDREGLRLKGWKRKGQEGE